MSAIAGIMYFGGVLVEPGLVEKLTGAMRRRGPDEQTYWSNGSVALGHCMLRTTPESLNENQPVTSQDKNLVLVWDGRLDNREELQGDLVALGGILRDNSDAELVLQSYAVWGEDCPTRLLGDFAFAIWDARQNHLFCVRDHMGARPFFWTRNEQFFAFASDDEALLHLPGVSHKPSEEHIAYFLMTSYEGFDYRHSWLKDVWSLMSAQTMTVSPDRTEQKNIYWQLEVGDEAIYASDEECQEAFLKVFGEAVRCRMRTIGDISAMMSGGLDSASIAAMVKRLLPEMPGKQFHTYSAISDHPETCVESRCILSLIKDMGDNAHSVSVPSFTGMLNVQDLIETAWSKPHPIDNSILLPAMMCLAAGRSAHRVVLHGVCGDLTMYAPYLYIAWLLKARQWRHAWRECRAASRNNTYLQGISPFLILLRNLFHSSAPSGIKRLARRLRNLKNESPLTRSLINAEFAQRLKLAEWLGARDRQETPSLTNLQEDHIRAMQPPHGITSSTGGYNRLAGKHGVELRDPWGDRRVVEFCLRLPLKYKVRNGWTKYLVRSTFAADLAPEVRWRLGKQHVGWNFFYRLMDETAALVSHTLIHSLGAVDRYVDVDTVHNHYAKYLVTKSHAERENIFNIVTLARWVE